jgi:hypothetical protein
MIMKRTVFCDVSPCRRLQAFGGTCRLHLHCRKLSQANNQKMQVEQNWKQSLPKKCYFSYWDTGQERIRCNMKCARDFKEKKTAMSDHEMNRNAAVQFKFYQFADCYPNPQKKSNLLNLYLTYVCFIYGHKPRGLDPRVHDVASRNSGATTYASFQFPFLFVCIFCLYFAICSRLLCEEGTTYHCSVCRLVFKMAERGFLFLIRNCLAWKRQREKYNKSETWQSTLYTATIKEKTRGNLRKYSPS